MTKYGVCCFSSGLILTGCNGIYCPICKESTYMILLFFIYILFYQGFSVKSKKKILKPYGNIVFSNNFLYITK